MTGDNPLIEAIDLTKRYRIGRSVAGRWGGTDVHAVSSVSLTVMRGETVGIVGESGSGKSTLGRCMTRLYDITDGRLVFDGRDITHLNGRDLLPVRRRVQMIFQDPSASLNPRRRVRELIAEPIKVHGLRPRAEVKDRLVELMRLVGLPVEALDRYPHEFSGGQRQRVGIARALAMEPDLIVADEPVSALDVSVQAQIINLFADLRDRLKLTYLFIAHDLGVVRQISTRVVVMYLGTIVETGETDTVFAAPAHPYTQALLSAIPRVGGGGSGRIMLEGDLPSPVSPPKGCVFSTRCPQASDICRQVRPTLSERSDGRSVACHHA
jgi:peptide/nickel transport system ATP-binding protein